MLEHARIENLGIATSVVGTPPIVSRDDRCRAIHSKKLCMIPPSSVICETYH